MEIQAYAMVEMAKQHAMETKRNAKTAQAEFHDRQSARATWMKIISGYMDSRRDYESQLMNTFGQCRGNISVEERMSLNRERDVIQMRLREIDTWIARFCEKL
jgi:hypothetical protein